MVFIYFFNKLGFDNFFFYVSICSQLVKYIKPVVKFSPDVLNLQMKPSKNVSNLSGWLCINKYWLHKRYLCKWHKLDLLREGLFKVVTRQATWVLTLSVLSCGNNSANTTSPPWPFIEPEHYINIYLLANPQWKNELYKVWKNSPPKIYSDPIPVLSKPYIKYLY